VLMKDPEFRGPTLPYQAAENQAFDIKRTVQQAKQYEAVRNEHFPRAQEFLQSVKGFTREQVDRLITGEGEGQYRKVHGYRWVDSRKLGGLNKQNPLLGLMEYRVGRGLIHFFDAINTAQKMAILYLKPAYAIPNMLGNVFLNLVQQGPLAPYNLALSVAAHKFMDVSTRQRIRAIMGAGASDVLRAQGIHGWTAHLSNWFAAKYGTLVDDPFRFSSFLYEARASGFRSLDDLYRLTHDPEYADQFRAIGNRANDSVINYELLSPGEQAMARRIIFFYPWVKGSTRYATQLLKEHPTAAGAIAATGTYGTNILEELFPGGLPPWAEGSIVYSPPNAQGYATVGNPSSAAILQEPADLLRTAVGLFSKNPDASAGILHQVAPADEALLALGTQGQYSSIPHKASTPPWEVAINEMFGGNPLYNLIHFMLHGPNQTGLYPDPSKWHALSRWGLLGSLGPRQIDAYKAAEQAWRANNVSGYVGG